MATLTRDPLDAARTRLATVLARVCRGVPDRDMQEVWEALKAYTTAANAPYGKEM